MKWTLTRVSVTVLAAAVAGSSAANPALANNNSFVLGVVPNGLATTTGFGLIESVVLVDATGVVTATTRAAVAAADMVLTVIIATPHNS